MPLQAYKNLAYSLVATAPSPADTGTSLVVTGGHGTRFPSVPFNATIWPADSIPTPLNAEIVTVTAVSTDTLTITRAQESSTARTVIVGDQIAATITALTLATLEADISAVSAAVTSVNTHANTASAAATSADAHASAASAAATSADGHAAAASAAATSVDTRVNTVSNLVSALTSAHNALSNVVSDSLSAGASAVAAVSNAISNELSVRAASVQTASAAATSADGHANTASAAATSADAHAAAASAAATSVNSRVTSVNAALSALSARSVGGVSTHGLQSVLDALSNRISAVPGGSGSVTSQEVSVLVQVASAAATSADAHAATASAAATSADAHAAAASAAATSVLAGISAVSARSVGGVSTHGLQSVVDALSNRISAIPGAASSPAIRILSVTATVEAATLTVISGLSVSVSAGAIYRMDGLALINRATAQVGGVGLTFPAMTQAGGRAYTVFSGIQSSGGQMFRVWRGDAAGSILLSLSAGGNASIVFMVEGVLFPSAGGQVAMMLYASTGVGSQVLPGSYLELKRIGP